MNKPTKTEKLRAMENALASVRIEGLEPSGATKKRMRRYANGEITLQEARQATHEENIQIASAHTVR